MMILGLINSMTSIISKHVMLKGSSTGARLGTPRVFSIMYLNCTKFIFMFGISSSLLLMGSSVLSSCETRFSMDLFFFIFFEASWDVLL